MVICCTTISCVRCNCTLVCGEHVLGSRRTDVPSADAADDLHDDVQLVLYGLQRQADDGPCTASKPWGW